jgi:GT2 family glycosyltransferase
MWSIILVVFDPLDSFSAGGAIQRCISSINRLQGRFELIIVNNNPLARVPSLTRSLRELNAQNSLLLEPDGNLGSSGGFNVGLRAASTNSDFLAFMSADAEIIDGEMLERLEQTFRQFSKVGVLHPWSVFEDPREYNCSREYGAARCFTQIRDYGPIESEDMILRNSTALLRARSRHPRFKGPLRSMPLTFAAIRRSAINAVGTFDEGIKGVCCENDDFAFRCLRAGFDVGLAKNTSVYHHRYLFYRLTHRDDEALVPHAEAIDQSIQWWLRKWGKPYAQIYFDWRWGKAASLCAKPYFACRAIAGKLRRKIYRW